MTLSVFIDANVPMYAAGKSHPLKQPCGQVLILAAEHAGQFVTNAEVLQELLHRYVAQRDWAAGSIILQEFGELMRGRIEPVMGDDVLRADVLVSQHPRLSARDLVHLAVMQRLSVTRVVSADRGFDDVQGIERLDPARWAEWRESVTATS